MTPSSATTSNLILEPRSCVAKLLPRIFHRRCEKPVRRRNPSRERTRPWLASRTGRRFAPSRRKNGAKIPHHWHQCPQSKDDESGKPLSAVTRKVYNLATRARAAKKREVLDAWAIELRRIVGVPPVKAADPMLRLVV
jgi:hypothetical protein